MKKQTDGQKKVVHGDVQDVPEGTDDAVMQETVNEAEEWKNKYLRALADYNNLDRRTRDEKNEIRQYAEESVLRKLLPVLDTFYKAHGHLKDPGLGLAVREFEAVLTDCGVRKIETVGKPFNPHEMECIEVVEGTENEVVSEVSAGYRYHDRVLKVAQVTVGKNLAN